MPSPPLFQAVRHAALTDVGVKRTHNQDAFAVQPAPDAEHWKSQGHIFVVADGMGGHAVGEKASAKAVRDIPLTYTKHAAQEGPAAAIRRAFVEANRAINQIGQNNPEFKGLGTTGTALFLRPDGAWVGHVGDSRCYRVRGERVQQLTFDHSWVWEMAERQGIDPDELGDFRKNVITRSLGPDAEVEVDVEGPHPLAPGDQFLLCSDGLCNLIPPEEIGAVLATFPPDDAAKFLVEMANLRGGPDNITCLIVQVPDDAAPRRASRGPTAAARLGAIPWPLPALGGGLVLAALAVTLKAVAEADGPAVAAFALAAVAIVAGVVGVARAANRPEEVGTSQTDATPLPRIHRDKPFEVGEQLTERYTKLEASLREACKSREVPVDWTAHSQVAGEAEVAAHKRAWSTAFRARCQAILTLSVPFNKGRQKEESFQPNFSKKNGE